MASLDGRNLDEGGSNGSGKSSIFMAIRWCLFGIAGDEIILRKRRSVSAHLVCNIDSTLYRISRFRKRGGKSTAFVEVRRRRKWYKQPYRTIPDVQAWIDSTFGINRSLFSVSTLFAPSYGSSRFGQLTDAQRKRLIEQVLKLDELEELRKHFSRKVRATENDLISHRTSARTWLQTRGTVIKSIASTKEKCALWEKDQREKIDALRRTKERKPNFSETDKKLEAEAKTVSDLKEKMEKVKERQQRWLIERLPRDIEPDLASVRQELKEKDMLLRSNRCPTCKQDLGALHLDLSKEVASLRAKERVLNDESKKAKLREKAVGELRDREQRLNQALTQAKFRVARLEATKAEKRRQYVRDVKRMDSEIHALQSQDNPHSESLKEDYADLVNINAALMTAMQKRKYHKAMLVVYSFWKKGFSSRGVKSIILVQALPYLSQYAISHLEGFYPQGRILVDATTVLKSSREVDKISVSVDLGTGQTVPYASLSGGEKQRVDLALFFGWADFIETFRGYRSSIWFMDEAFESLDVVGAACVLDAIRKSRRSGLIITHLPTLQETLKNRFQRNLTAVKQNGVSRILGGRNEFDRSESALAVAPPSESKVGDSKTRSVKSLRRGGESRFSKHQIRARGGGKVRIKVGSER